MPQIILHILDARDQLSHLRDWLDDTLKTTFDTSAALLPLGDTDVVVKTGKNVIPELGHMGYAPEPGVIYVTVDPDHPSLRENAGRSIERMLAHELHHSARWDGPGYGNTLGQALVSEGLAGHFEHELFGGRPNPWESLPSSTLRSYVTKARDEWDNTGYDHEAWFFGSPELPDGLGYSLGHQLVARYLSSHQSASASGLVHAGAEIFLPHLGEV